LCVVVVFGGFRLVAVRRLVGIGRVAGFLAGSKGCSASDLVLLLLRAALFQAFTARNADSFEASRGIRYTRACGRCRFRFGPAV
jgi:hypothetical protein